MIYTVSDAEKGLRLDAFCAEAAGITRSAAARLIEEGSISVSGRTEAKKYAVKVGDSVAEPHSLYMVVTGLYTAQLIGLLESESYGLLSAVAKDSSGRPLQDGFICLRDGNGAQIAEWEAFAKYLQQYGFDPHADEESVENDDFVPLGYTLGAILLCAAILYFMRKRE